MGNEGVLDDRFRPKAVPERSRKPTLPALRMRTSLQIAAGPRYYVAHFDNGAKGWSARVNFTVLLPR